MDAKDAEIARLRNELERAQHEVDEVLESTKDIEAQLEQDILQAEKELDETRRKNDDLKYDIREWRERLTKAQAVHEKEIAGLHSELAKMRSTYDKLRKDLLEEELRHDDLERQERIVTTSYQDLERKYHEVLEKNADLECEVSSRRTLEMDCQRLKDEVRDLTEELAVHHMQKAGIKEAEDLGRSKDIKESSSPQDSPVMNAKQTYFVKTPEKLAIGTSPGRTGIPVPPYRLATSKSVRNLQSLSSTITALREKMKAAREVPTTARPPSALRANDHRPNVSHISVDALADSMAASDLHNRMISPERQSEALRKTNRRQSGIPTPDRTRTRKSLITVQSPSMSRSQARQNLSASVSEHASRDKFSINSSNRSTSRRSSILPTGANSGYPQMTAHSLTYAQRGEVKRSNRPSRDNAIDLSSSKRLFTQNATTIERTA